MVTGASGLLGATIVYKTRAVAEVLACSWRHPLRPAGFVTKQVDLSDASSFRTIVRQFRPEWILHAAAETNVDRSERQPDTAYVANVVATETVAGAADEFGARLLFISTDSVFDGRCGSYIETDPPNPVNQYAASKLEAERRATAVAPGSLIVRTNFYGWNVQPKQSLAEWALFALRRGECVSGWNDVFFSPLFTSDLADLLLTMMERRLSGLYHVCGSERCSKYDFVRAVANTWGLDGRRVLPTSIGETPAVRPRDTSLRCDKFLADLGGSLPSVQTGLSHMRQWEVSALPELKALLVS